MKPTATAIHTSEVKKGERFEFGKNWRRFLSTLNDERIALAEQSLRKFLATDDLVGKTFLDVGSGSGLFSLAARRLGAKVHSFDFDPQSVACTNELRRRYFDDDSNWISEQASVLDRDYLAALGTFDILYSWGVLHHTGAMWQALENVKPLVRQDGQLFIAIYNDLGAVTDRWRRVKQTYNRLPALLRLPFALTVIAGTETPAILGHARRKNLKTYIRTWTDYARTSTRGMSRWHDWIDWVGGYPYECATIEAIVDFFGKDGFVLEYLESRAAGTGCNEFVFRRKASVGVFIDNLLNSSRFVLRQSGRRVIGPLRHDKEGYIGSVPEALRGSTNGSLLLFCDGELIGPARLGDEPETIVVAPPEWTEEKVNTTRFEVVRGRLEAITQTLQFATGHMYLVSYPNLVNLADNAPGRENKSPVVIFEDKRQLAYPHSIHDQIVKHGAGRFSHWGQEILFSSSDNSDPRSNGRVYYLVIADSHGTEI